MKCREAYPVLRGRVPVLVENPSGFISLLYWKYQEFCQRLAAQLQACASTAGARPERAAVIARYQTALRSHLDSVRGLMEDLQPHVSLRGLASVSREMDIPYVHNFNYLRRDWCGEEACERELAEIAATLRRLLADRPALPENSLVLGAGAGRTAWDLCEWLPQVTAIDLSYTMAGLFDRVLTGPVEFYEVNRSNTRLTADLVRPRVARLPDERAKADHLRRFSFAVADAKQLPLCDASVDAVFSLFFTDVLPLQRLIGEVQRVLKPGGVFVHFGPLDYHFEDFADSLSGEEMREQLAQHGFPITKELIVESTHLATSGQLSRQVFENWAFVAENRNEAKTGSLSMNDVLWLPHPVRYEVTGILHAGEDLRSIYLFLPDGTRFECGPGVPALLTLIDGRRPVQEIINLMRSEYPMQNESSAMNLLETLRSLIEIRVVARSS